jgi:hypothetical protein
LPKKASAPLIGERIAKRLFLARWGGELRMGVSMGFSLGGVLQYSMVKICGNFPALPQDKSYY